MNKLRQITCKFRGVKCAACRSSIAYDTAFFWDKYGNQGKKNFCLSCGKDRDATPRPIDGIPAPVPTPEYDGAPIARHPDTVIVKTSGTSGDSAPASGIDAYFMNMIQEALQGFQPDVPEVTFDDAKLIELIHAHAVRRIEVTTPAKLEPIDLGIQHKQFADLLKAASARLSDGHRLNIWIGGPAGSGKSKAGEYTAKALGLEFAYTGSFNESHKIFGYVSPIDGKYHSTPFRDAYENGKAFMFDDFDGSDPACAVELLGMLANGHAAFPDGMVARHADFLALVSANTFGHGATSDYVGRLKQDKALLNRFIVFNWEYDEVLEVATSGNASWAKRVQRIRKKVAEKGLKVLVTPRATYQGAALLAAGFDQDQAEMMVIGNSMSKEQWEMVR